LSSVAVFLTKSGNPALTASVSRAINLSELQKAEGGRDLRFNLQTVPHVPVRFSLGAAGYRENKAMMAPNQLGYFQACHSRRQRIERKAQAEQQIFQLLGHMWRGIFFAASCGFRELVGGCGPVTVLPSI